MTPRRLLDLVLTVSIGIAIFVGILFGLRVIVGRTGVGFPVIDALLVPQEWFMPTRVTMTDERTVRVEGVTQGVEWSSGDRSWSVTGATLLLWEGNAETYPPMTDGRVQIQHAFTSGGLSRPVGWHVIRIEQRDGGKPVAAAYVLVDLTKMVWLKRTGPIEWQTLPIEQ